MASAQKGVPQRLHAVSPLALAASTQRQPLQAGLTQS